MTREQLGPWIVPLIPRGLPGPAAVPPRRHTGRVIAVTASPQGRGSASCGSWSRSTPSRRRTSSCSTSFSKAGLELKESFPTKCDALGAPGSVGELNARGQLGVAERVHARVHSTTVARRRSALGTEWSLLGPLPRRPYDTAYVVSRRVHPPAAGGVGRRRVVLGGPVLCREVVSCRVQVDTDEVVVRWRTSVVARHLLSPAPPRRVGPRPRRPPPQHHATASRPARQDSGLDMTNPHRVTSPGMRAYFGTG